MITFRFLGREGQKRIQRVKEELVELKNALIDPIPPLPQPPKRKRLAGEEMPKVVSILRQYHFKVEDVGDNLCRVFWFFNDRLVDEDLVSVQDAAELAKRWY